MSVVVLDQLGKSFGTTPVFRDISIAIDRGTMCVLVGPSGCGKTTLLRTIAGLATPDSGRVLIDGRDATFMPPRERNVGMVFQHYALFPNLTVQQNLAFGLAQQKRPRAEIKRRVAAMIELVGLQDRARARPDALSGGQKQRVALARALVTEPKLMLFDEPMSALDAQIRKRLRDELKKLQKQIGFTGLFVTHDQEEALTIGDTIAVMQGGRFQQVGSPFDVYNRPISRAVARFIGDFNVLEPADVARAFGRAVGKAWALHPEALTLHTAPTSGPDGATARGRIGSVRLMGPIVRYSVDCEGVVLKADTLNRPDTTPLAEGESVYVHAAEPVIRALDD